MSAPEVTSHTNTYSSWIVASLAALIGILLVSVWAGRVLGEERFSDGLSTQRDIVTDRADAPAGEITGDGSVSQSFLATRPDLASVDILLINFLRPNDPDLVFTLNEVNRPEGPLRTIVVAAEEIRDAKLHRFGFAPIANSAGKAYVARLESPDGVPGNAFSAWVGECDCYKDGNLFINGESLVDRDLSMQVVYSFGRVSVGEELTNRLSQHKPLFFKGIALLAIAVTSILLAAATLGRMAITLVPESRHDFQPWWVLASVLVAAVIIATWQM